MGEDEDEVSYRGPVAGRTKLVLAFLALVMVAGVAFEELDGLADGAGASGPMRLDGTWRLESFRGRAPAEAGIERIVLTLDGGGAASYALRRGADGTRPPELVPGRWRLAGDSLSVRFSDDRTLESEVTFLVDERVRLDPDPVAEEELGLTGPGVYRRP